MLHTDCLDDDTASITNSDSEYFFGQEELCEERNPEQEMADAKTDIVDKILAGEIDPDEIFTCDAFATSGTPRNGVTAEKISKVWRISLKDAKQTLGVTSQHCKRSEDPTMSRQYSTNDRMLRYKHVNEHFFMDTFFVKGKPSTRGYTCCQLFVTDKGFHMRRVFHISPSQERSYRRENF